MVQVQVCMVDTGVDLTHPDLVSNLWMNPAERNGPGATAANGYKNGLDDDGDGAPCPPACWLRKHPIPCLFPVCAWTCSLAG